MFNRYEFPTRIERVHETTTIHEHRAPTDASVDLLNEMTSKALSNLVSTFSTTSNTLQVTWSIYEDMARAQRNFLCKFSLNGKPYQIIEDIPLHRFGNQEEVVKHLYEVLCKRLASDLMGPLLKEMQGFVGRRNHE